MDIEKCNDTIREALEIWEEWNPHHTKFDSAYDRYMFRRLDAFLKYIAEKSLEK